MLDPTMLVGEAAAVVDPKGENEDVTVLCGLVGWAITHPNEYDGWNPHTVHAALRWSFGDEDAAKEIAHRLIDE